jgi:addiction module HigA family antidote
MEISRKPVHPGTVLLNDVLVPLNLSVTQAAEILGITRRALSDFVNEKSACSAHMALRVAAATHTNPESWLGMQSKLDIWKARQNTLNNLQEFPKLAV